MPSKTIQGVDLLKFILSIMIIAAHTNLLGEYGTLAKFREILTSIAVPMFFAISSFFFYRKIESTSKGESPLPILKKSVVRLTILFGSWYMMMLPMTYICFFSIATWKEVVFALLFSCCFTGYWFIKALLINTLLIYLFRKSKALLMFSFVALIINLYCSYNYIYHFNIKLFDFHPYYSFYYHMAYFCLGALFAKYQNAFNFSKRHKTLLIVIWSTLFIMTFSYKTGPILRLLSFPLLFPIFLHLNLTPNPKYRTMRDMSIILYMVQFILIRLYNGACHAFLHKSSYLLQIFQFSIVRFIIVLLTALGVAILIIRYETRYKLLKYLH
ncbi:MAG: acyltransferase family protein [Prevotella sp.]|nr:acyltransferase family protein [Prevotella sp.]